MPAIKQKSFKTGFGSKTLNVDKKSEIKELLESRTGLAAKHFNSYKQEDERVYKHLKMENNHVIVEKIRFLTK